VRKHPRLFATLLPNAEAKREGLHNYKTNAEGLQMDNVTKEGCEMKHKRVDERLDHHEGWLKDHEKKIDVLEKSDATNTNEIKNLCGSIESQNKRIGSLTNAIWGLVTGIFFVLLGFVFWYIQSLPRGGTP
jgi:tetrahydromethanopterin S-methyltransferase subunit B